MNAPVPAAHRRLAYAKETERQAWELYDLIFPPWRWGNWWRKYREVRKRIATSRRWREQLPLV